MTASPETERQPPSSELDLTLDRPVRETIMTGNGSALFCAGTCSEGDRPVAEVSLVVDGRRYRPAAQRMPRHDREPSQSGFWGMIPIEVQRPRELELTLEAKLRDGRTATAPVASISVVERLAPAQVAGRKPSIAICLATYNSDPGLFRVQIESIRAQTDEDWMCLVGDDASEPEQLSAIKEVIDGDPRFVLLPSEERLGFYRNFERLVASAPPGVEFVALCDHDDRWYPDKLAALRVAIEGAELAYSDLRIVDQAGKVRAETFFEGRRENHTNLASLLVSNTIAGAACLVRRRAVERALPFPEGPGWDFHDHWLALVALSLGRIAYVDRPLYDYVQHPGAVLGHTAGEQRRRDRGPAAWLAARRGALARWRSAYFGILLQRDLQARVLLARCAAELTPRKRRALKLMSRATRSPVALAWLALRPLRALWGRNETLGLESLMARAVIWRHLIALRRLSSRNPGPGTDASPQPFDPKALGARRRRWLAERG